MNDDKDFEHLQKQLIALSVYINELMDTQAFHSSVLNELIVSVDTLTTKVEQAIVTMNADYTEEINKLCTELVNLRTEFDIFKKKCEETQYNNYICAFIVIALAAGTIILSIVKGLL